MEMKILVEILKSIKKSNERLDELENLINDLNSVSKAQIEISEDIVVPITEDVYDKICKELGSGCLFFMGIA
jgi:hypothetical protein|tara:strand:- start:533 stop:748 length:216 start_codon:yes stop_codon:yes gene_type:complete